MCDYQRSSGHVVTRWGSTDRSTGPYRCTIDVRTPWARHGVPTGPPEPRRDLKGPWRSAGGSLTGASPVWAARSSYWRSQGYLYFTPGVASLKERSLSHVVRPS